MDDSNEYKTNRRQSLRLKRYKKKNHLRKRNIKQRLRSAKNRDAGFYRQLTSELVTPSTDTEKQKSKKSASIYEISRSGRDVSKNEKWLVLNTTRRDDSSDDDVLCHKTLQNANALVKECFKEVLAITQKEVTDPELNNFCQIVNSFNNASNSQRVYKTFDGSAGANVCIPIIGPSSAHGKEVVVVDQNSNNQSVYATVLTTNKGVLPRIRFFTHSEQNIWTPDTSRLSHVPYVDGLSKDDDEYFLEDLNNSYPEGIHGHFHGCGEHIDDFMMWKLLELTLSKWNEDSSYIIKAIFEMFPNKYTYHQLQSRKTRLSLKQRFEGSSKDTSQMKGEELIGGISSLLCSKCLIFNCPSHKAVEDVGLPALPPVSMPKRSVSSCGDECFLSCSKEGSTIIPNLDSKILIDMFRSFISRNEYDLCKVAGNMNVMCSTLRIPTLHCREWYSLVLSLQKEFSDVQEERTHSVFNIRNRDKQRERAKHFLNTIKKRNMDKIDNSVNLTPCNHPGKSCDANNCACFYGGGVCTKFCRCDIDCSIKFPGCTCSAGNCSTGTCQCFLANWECDPDTCFSCNCDGSHPIKSLSDTDDLPKLCRNISVQLKLQKQLKIGLSTIPNAGHGCFLVGTAAPGDLISEYAGEQISFEETERRGLTYDKMKCSYVFGLPNEKSIDSGRIGNLIRFANNDSKDPNCVGKTMVVNGEPRNAVYAKKHIKDGEELFFDYNYEEEHRSFVGLSP